MARKKIEIPEGPPKNAKFKALAKVAGRFESLGQARNILTKVRAVPTIFPAVDWALGVGGWPLERFAVVHGPSAHGKSSMCLGLGLSFLERGHFFAFIDAEYTTPADWLEEIFHEHLDNPAFVALRPKSYEETVDAVRGFVKTIAAAREKNEIPEDTSALIVVDSLKKLTPENFMKKIAAQGAQGEKGSVDGMRGMGAMTAKPRLHAQWLDELTPLLYHTGTTMIAIARESEKNDPRAHTDWKMNGGKAIEYDSSVVARATREWVKEGSGDDAEIVGEKHYVTIRKSKVSGKDDKVVEGFFHTSNGKVVPEGLDRARDLLGLGVQLDVVEQSGSWFSWGGKRWQGKSGAVRTLNADVALADKLEEELRSKFGPTLAKDGTKFDKDGVVE